MPDFKTRLLKESAELEEKLNKLSNFLLSENKPAAITELDIELLSIQESAMKTYARCLNCRIRKL